MRIATLWDEAYGYPGQRKQTRLCATIVREFPSSAREVAARLGAKEFGEPGAFAGRDVRCCLLVLYVSAHEVPAGSGGRVTEQGVLIGRT